MIREAKTENGWVKGIEAADPRITAFKGIPFAAPPVKENRWRKPQPCENWEGVREAYRFAPISVQDQPGIGNGLYDREWHVDSGIEMSEDCLYLNVWTPAKSVEDNLPVVVWYFGGGFQWGYTAEMEMDGERIARRGIVVVSVNYRLNVFGFLAHPELTKEQPDAPTNFGCLDQQAGLQWVIRNIKEFGGNPSNITIAGQSAGGGSVMAQMTCPDNDGLFQKAIVQSGMIRSPYKDGLLIKPAKLEEAKRRGEEFFELLGVHTLEEARQLDPYYIREKYAQYMQTHPMMTTVIDNHFCFGDPLELYLEGKHAKVALLAGNTADEFPNSIPAESEEEFRKKVKNLFGEKAQQFLEFEEAWHKEGANHYGVVSGIECTVKTLFRETQKQGGEPCYYYRFDANIPGADNPGTFHSVELWFFFETLAKCWRPFRGEHYNLARQMCNYWCNFVKTGNPNGLDDDGSPLPTWLPYTTETPCDMVFQTGGAVLEQKKESEFKIFLMDWIKELLRGEE